MRRVCIWNNTRQFVPLLSIVQQDFTFLTTKLEEDSAGLGAQTHELEVYYHRNVVQQCVHGPCGLVDLDSSSMLGKDCSGETL